MKRLTSAACFAALLLLMCLSVRAAGVLPVSRAGLIADKYDSWTGVLRLWVYEGWPTEKNSLTAWLNFSIGKFEKSHPGLYVQAKRVDAQAIRELASSGINPPDLILFPPSLLDTPENLAPLSSSLSAPLRDGLNQSPYALPIAMGAYALAESEPGSDTSLTLPADEPYRNWSAALLCLLSDSDSDSTPNSTSPPGPGLDLGLPLPLPNAVSGAHWGRAAETPVSAVCSTQNNVPPRMSALGDSKGEIPLWQGIQGDGVSLAVTQHELPDSDNITIPGRYALADQLALMAVIEWPRDDIAERKMLGEELIAHLLSREMQEALSKSGAFPVRADAIAYSGRGAMATIETALAEKILIAPDAFSNGWREKTPALLNDLLAGRISADEAVRQFTASLHGTHISTPAK